MKKAFTLIELVVTVSIITALTAMMVGVFGKVRQTSESARCMQNLRQLGAATNLYLGDNNQTFFPYRRGSTEGIVWYFGLEQGTTWLSGEGHRDLDVTRGPLFPYLNTVGGVEICHALEYNSALWKPKFKGASWGYGYNVLLGGGVLGMDRPKSVLNLSSPSRVIVFGDCAQVNTFQPPASAKNPMIEEFYIIDQGSKTIHFRHGGHANMLFADGHVQAMTMFHGTGDNRLSSAQIGRVTETGSMEYLR